MYVINIDEEGRFGGPEKRIINVAKELGKFNVKTKIIMPYLHSTDFENYALKNKVDFKKLNLTRLTLEKKYLLRYMYKFFIEIFILYKFLKKENPDVVHINGAYQFKSYIAAYLSKKKIVWHLNNQYTHKVVKIFFDFFKRNKSLSFIVASQKAREYFIPNVSSQITVTEIHAPIEISKYFKKTRYEINKKVIVGTTTNLSPQKDLISFVRSAYRIKKEYPTVEFHIGGPFHSSHQKYFKKVIKEIEELKMKDEIKFLGFISDIPHFLSKLDIFVNSSAWEGSPTAVWEALAAGLPVVTTDVGSTNYYVGELKAGIVTKVRDYKMIAQNVLELIKNKDLRENYGQRAKYVAQNYLSLEKCASLHFQHYKSIQ